MADLTGPRLKLRRTKHHLDALNSIIQGFLNPNPYVIRLDPDSKPPDYRLLARLARPVPDEAGLIVGDFANNARSALDHLIQAISALPPYDSKRRRLQFPIFDTPTGYTDTKSRYLAGVGAADEAIIESFQPYKSVGGHIADPLYLLAHINDADKHRLINVVAAVPQYGGITLSGGRAGMGIQMQGNARITLGRNTSVGGPGFSYRQIGDGVITVNETPVAEIYHRSPFNVNVQPQISLPIQFGEGDVGVKGREVHPTLLLIIKRVEEIVGKF